VITGKPLAQVLPSVKDEAARNQAIVLKMQQVLVLLSSHDNWN
jgi:hypothetical protein